MGPRKEIRQCLLVCRAPLDDMMFRIGEAHQARETQNTDSLTLSLYDFVLLPTREKSIYRELRHTGHLG